MQKRPIGVSTLPNLLHNHLIVKGCTLNIMVVGSKGLGKTTFLNQFLGKSILKSQPFEPKNDNPFWHLEDVCNIQTSYVEILEGEFTTKINLTEVDGIGDCVENSNCYEPVVSFLESKFDDYQNKFKNSVKQLIDDNRVHLCLYFLEPISFIKESDLTTLKHISKYCTILPIISKADLLDNDKIMEIRHSFREILNDKNIPFYDDKEASTEAPYFVFSHDRQASSNYVWNSASYSNIQVNEFPEIKKMILEKCITTFIEQTDQFYDNYRILKMLKNTHDSGTRAVFEQKIKNYQSKMKILHDNIRNGAAGCEESIFANE